IRADAAMQADAHLGEQQRSDLQNQLYHRIAAFESGSVEQIAQHVSTAPAGAAGLGVGPNQETAPTASGGRGDGVSAAAVYNQRVTAFQRGAIGVGLGVGALTVNGIAVHYLYHHYYYHLQPPMMMMMPGAD